MPAEQKGVPGQEGVPGRDASPDPRPRRRGPRRATGGTFSGEEPRLPDPGGPAPGWGEEAAERAGEPAHEDWLRAQRPPHWG
ncbi:hypothetical protein ACH9DO_16285 [Kocuria sp. M1N1S27]|uniref:hypothetical protein n=1 Tax=Kocuria kalidii TaxID=3376283 RepID=UPI00378B16FC